MTYIAKIIFVLFSLSSYGQQYNFGLNISNPIRDTKVGWFDIDSESFDGYDLKNQSIAFEFVALKPLEHIDIRLRFNYMHLNILEYQDNYLIGNRNQESIHGIQNKFSVAPGIFRRLDFDKLSLSFGFECIYTSHGEFSVNIESIQSDSASTTIISDYYATSTIPSGFAIGIGSPLNFGFKLGKRFVLQAEYSPSLHYANLGGTTVHTGYSNKPSYTNYGTTYTEDAYEGFAHLEHRFSFGIQYWVQL